MKRGFAWLEEIAGTRRGVVYLFVAALAVYGVQSIGIPLFAGRDLVTYLRYYEQLFDGDAVLPMSMLYRTPVGSVVVGAPLDLVGAAGTQVLFGLLYGASIVAWAAAALAFGRRPALVTGVVLLAYPGYGILFHALSADAVFAAGFAGWALLLTRAVVRPSLLRFALVGLAVAVLALIRPGNQVLLVFSLVPLALGVPWRRRLALAASSLAAAVALLGAATLHNGLRYGDYTVARGGGAFIPFFRAYLADRIVSPENGPASRELATAVERQLLPKEPYRSYGIDSQTFFSAGDMGMWEDLVSLSDRVWGWESDYSKLRAVAFEALRAHPGTYAKGVAHTILSELWQPVFKTPGLTASTAGGDVVVVNGRTLPRPTDGAAIPAARQGLYSTTRDGSIREVWTSPTAHRVVFDDPDDQRRYDRLTQDVGRLAATIPAYDGNDWVLLYVNRASRWFPRPLLWLAVGLAAILLRRPRRSWLALALAFAALLVVTFTALGINALVEYATPVVPAFAVLAAVRLAGPRGSRVEPQPTAP